MPVPDFIKELFPRDLRTELDEIPLGLPDLNLVWMALFTAFKDRIFDMIDLNVWRNPAHWEQFLEGYIREIRRLRATDLKTLDTSQLDNFYQQCEDLLFAYRKIHLGSLLIGNCIYQLLGVLIQKWTKADPEVFKAHIVAGLSGSKTLETNKSLWLLAHEAARRPLVKALFLENKAEDVRDRLSEPAFSGFRTFLDGFLEHYGHRCHNSYEFASVSWCRDPLPVIEAVQSYLRDGALDSTPFENERKMQVERLNATESVLSNYWRWTLLPALPLRKQMFRGLLSLNHDYMLLRENQRFYFDLIVTVMKDVFYEMGERLVKRKVLEEPRDILFMRIEEVRSVLKGGKFEQGTLKARKLAYTAAKDNTPPTYLLGDDPYWDSTGEEDSLLGLGVSPGTCEGVVRIVNVPKDFASFREGEVLVTTGTDPGWTPLFIRASGLITEIGGRLSHGAVVAREYGLPAVVGVANATHVLVNGQRVRVDGSTGTVQVLG